MPIKSKKNKPAIQRASAFEREQCKIILESIRQHIPGVFAPRVQEILKEKGRIVSLTKIHNVKKGLSADLEIVQALQSICQIPEDLGIDLVKELNLVKP